jgi:sec-independent protein translocase protein TatB
VQASALRVGPHRGPPFVLTPASLHPRNAQELRRVPGSQELLVIALVALFVLGPERLPGLARTAAKGLVKLRNYGVTASKELRGVADLSDIEREVNDLRRELQRTRADLRRAMRETVASSSSSSAAPRPTVDPSPATSSSGAGPSAVPEQSAVEAAATDQPVDGSTGPRDV